MSKKGPNPVKGILGVPRSAERQVLLFSRFAEALPSDDSEDSDYEPTNCNSASASDTETSKPKDPNDGKRQEKNKQGNDKKLLKKSSGERANRNSSKKRKLKNDNNKLKISDKTGLKAAPQPNDLSRKRRKLNTDQRPVTFDKTADSLRAWSDLIPTEVLLKVFTYCVESQGAFPLLGRLSRVCHRWNTMCKEPNLWRKIDLSNVGKYTIASDKLIKQLIRRGLSGAEELNLDGWKKLTDKGVETLVLHCSNLKTLCLSNCDELTSKAVTALTEHGTSLTSIDLSGTKVDQNSLKKLIMTHGDKLTEILLRNCKNAATAILSIIQEYCPNLLSLDLSENYIRQFHVERLQAGCPKLQHLQLANLYLQPSVGKRAEREASRGFPDLEHLSFVCGSQASLSIDDNLMARMLKYSSRLKVLDIRGCYRVTVKGLEALCSTSLKSLYIGSTDANYSTVTAVLNKWRHSLRVLDLSCNTSVRDDSMMQLSRHQLPCLTGLDLTGTGVTSTGISHVLEGCPRLQDLNLSSCRGIPRGYKQRHIGENLARLAQQITSDSVVDLSQE